MGISRNYIIKCNRIPGQEVPFTIDFVNDKNNNTVIMPINICDYSDNSEICFRCVNNLWHILMANPNVVIPQPFDPLIP